MAAIETAKKTRYTKLSSSPVNLFLTSRDSVHIPWGSLLNHVFVFTHALMITQTGICKNSWYSTWLVLLRRLVNSQALTSFTTVQFGDQENLHQSGVFTRKKTKNKIQPILMTKQKNWKGERYSLVICQACKKCCCTSSFTNSNPHFNSWDQTSVSLNHIKCILFMSVDCIHHRKEMALDICWFQSQMITIKV